MHTFPKGSNGRDSAALTTTFMFKVSSGTKITL